MFKLPPLENEKLHQVLTLSQTTNFLNLSKFKEFADNNFKFDKMSENSPNG